MYFAHDSPSVRKTHCSIGSAKRLWKAATRNGWKKARNLLDNIAAAFQQQQKRYNLSLHSLFFLLQRPRSHFLQAPWTSVSWYDDAWEVLQWCQLWSYSFWDDAHGTYFWNEATNGRSQVHDAWAFNNEASCLFPDGTRNDMTRQIQAEGLFYLLRDRAF